MKRTLLLLFVITYQFGFSQLYKKPGFGIATVATGFTSSTAMAFLPDGRILVTEQDGRIFLIKNGHLVPNPIYTLVTQVGDDKGLIGIAVDPNFTSNGYIYLYHTKPDGTNDRLCRVTMPANSDIIDDETKVTLLEFDPIIAGWHHGGAMKFGLDGKLYIGIGDNLQGTANSQNDNTYWGKILRINKDGSVPSDNPYQNGSPQQKRTWAKGLRNPYTLDVNKITGKIFVNDVGGSYWEEINDVTSGNQNFGWGNAEGFDNTHTYADPEYAFAHHIGNNYTDSTGSCITGGCFFQGVASNWPIEYRGKYFFANLSGWINIIDPNATDIAGSRETFLHVAEYGVGITYLTLGTDGNLYYFNRSEGTLQKLVYINSNKPQFVDEPQDTSVVIGQPIRLKTTYASLSSNPVTYKWYKNGTLLGATTSYYNINIAASNHEGNYKCVICNSFGCDTSSAFLDVLPYNTRPIATITTPICISTYRGGQTINFSGFALDPEDGAVNTSSYLWTLDFYHNDHVHPSGTVGQAVNSGSFTIPVEGELAQDVYYKLTLKVTDSQGLTDTATVIIRPRLSKLTFNTIPAGIPISIDAPNIATPHEMSCTERLEVNVTAPEMYYDAFNNKYYYFYKWNTLEENSIFFTVPLSDTVLTATYLEYRAGRTINSPLINGVQYTFYDNVNNSLKFSNLTPSSNGYRTNLNIVNQANSDDFGAVMSTYLQINTMGLYKFYVEALARVSLTYEAVNSSSNDLIVNNANSQIQESSGFIGLGAGKHLFKLRYANSTSSASHLKIFYEGPGITKQAIPSNLFYVIDPGGKWSGLDEAGMSSVVISPNPAGNFVNIQFTDENMYSKIEIVDQLGRVVLSENNHKIFKTLDLTDLSDGNYLLVFSGNSNQLVEKLVIQK